MACVFVILVMLKGLMIAEPGFKLSLSDTPLSVSLSEGDLGLLQHSRWSAL